ncbi:MAG: VWA domain-containing protein [Planctomycetota bacterium]
MTILAQAAPRTEMHWEWLNAPAPWVLFLIVLPLIALFLYWVYRGERGTLTTPRRIFLGSLRAAALLLIIGFLCEPILTKERVQRENSFILVLVDDSFSMGIEDRLPRELQSKIEQAVGGSVSGTRLALVEEILTDTQIGFIEKLRSKGNVRIVACSDGVRELRDLPRLSDDDPLFERLEIPLELRGKVTRLGDSLYEAVNELRGEIITAVVLFTDGRDNGGVLRPEEAADRLQRREIPIHVVGVGNPEDPKDIRVFGLEVAEVALKDDIVPVDFNVINEGFEGRQIQVSLALENTATPGRKIPVTRQLITLGASGEPQPMRLEFKPRREGQFRVTLSAQVLDGEIFEDNNEAYKVVRVLAQKIRMLYVEGPPRWEYRHLTWSVTRDETMEVQVLLASADPQWIQESSDSMQPLVEFPQTKEELFEYHLLVIGDVAPDYFTPQQKEWILEFVDDIGGGVCFIAGQWFMPYKYRGDPLEKLFPLELEDVDSSYNQAKTNPFHVLLTPQGRTHPVMQLVGDPEENQHMLQAMGRSDVQLPGFYWYAPVKKLKRGGVALATHPEPHFRYGPRPIFAYQYFGRGRTFMSLVDSTWRWRRFRGNEFFYRFWGQVFRYASAGRLLGKTQRFSLSTDQQEYTLGTDVRALARVLDRNFKPTKNEQHEIFIERESSRGVDRRSVTSGQLPARPEYYEATFEATELGEHTIWIEDRDEKVATASYRVIAPQLEYSEPSMDRSRLRQIAERSGGAYHEVYDVARIPDQVEPLEREILISSEHRSLWDHYWWLLLVVALLTVEWVCRKVFRLL